MGKEKGLLRFCSRPVWWLQLFDIFNQGISGQAHSDTAADSVVLILGLQNGTVNAATVQLLFKEGDEIAVLYSEKQSGFAAAAEKLLSATEICVNAPNKQPLILDIVE
jgi:hypothetical protein